MKDKGAPIWSAPPMESGDGGGGTGRASTDRAGEREPARQPSPPVP